MTIELPIIHILLPDFFILVGAIFVPSLTCRKQCNKIFTLALCNSVSVMSILRFVLLEASTIVNASRNALAKLPSTGHVPSATAAAMAPNSSYLECLKLTHGLQETPVALQPVPEHFYDVRQPLGSSLSVLCGLFDQKTQYVSHGLLHNARE